MRPVFIPDRIPDLGNIQLFKKTDLVIVLAKLNIKCAGYLALLFTKQISKVIQL